MKSEKEPVDGTAPERLLFERSLHYCNIYSFQHIMKLNEKEQQGTTCNLQYLKGSDIGQGFGNLTRHAVVIKTAILPSRHS